MKILLGKSPIALRKCKGNDRKINTGQVKQQGVLNRLILIDEGYTSQMHYLDHLHILKKRRKICLQ